jgi:hypothetical protein
LQTADVSAVTVRLKLVESMPRKQLNIPRLLNPRIAFRLRQSKRINKAVTLAAKFPQLKSLKVSLELYADANTTHSRQIKYAVNLHHAKSMFYFECPNPECVRGDFDLSDALSTAIAAHEKAVTGEMRCHGWRNRDAIKKAYCRTILRYKLRLTY